MRRAPTPSSTEPGDHGARARGLQPGLERRSGVRLGLLAGVIGLGCCVYPVVLVLLGLSTATAAVSLGTELFREWGWAFKLAAVIFAGAAVALQIRRARACPVDRRPKVLRSAAWLVGTGVLSYGVLYAVTTWLGMLA